MQNKFFRSIKILWQKTTHFAEILYSLVFGKYWFPHIPLAILLILAGEKLLRAEFGNLWNEVIQHILFGDGNIKFDLIKLPPIFIGGGMILTAIGIFLRSKISWFMALSLSIATIALSFFDVLPLHLISFVIVILIVLLLSYRAFNKSSLAASTLFALTSLVIVIGYGAFGGYYIGNEFDPAITNLTKGLYYAVVTMSTVGYGDITPTTTNAQLFTISLIIIGIAVFATSITAVLAPILNSSLKTIVLSKRKKMKREDHFIVIGNTPIAINTYQELIARGHRVTRILAQQIDSDEIQDQDIIIGTPESESILKEAGIDSAKAVLAMLTIDSDNAFVILAIKEINPHVKTLTIVNESRNLNKIKLVQPDIILAPPVLGGALTAMVLTGEKISSEFVLDKLIYKAKKTTPINQSD